MRLARTILPLLTAVLCAASSSDAQVVPTQTSRGIDPTLARPFQLMLRGTNDTQAWLSAGTLEQPPRAYEVVLDLASGCVVESRPPFERIAALNRIGAFPIGVPPTPSTIMTPEQQHAQAEA